MEPKNIVISGISGRYPNCNNVEEFKTALLENIDLISEGDNRFPTEFYGVSKYMGKIADIDKFDASFFGLLPKQAKIMDPRHRILLEKVFECLYDAGFNPEELKGSKTGVYLAMSSLHHDPDDYCFKDTEGYVNLGFSTALGANRASYCFDFKGPSYSLDSACSSSLNVLTNAVNDIRSGITDSAVVCAAQLALNPLEMKDFEKLHLLSPSRCKVFAKHRDGYTRAESVVSFFLQKRENARRIYAEVVGVKSVSDGFKKEEIASPSHTRQSEMIRDLYASSNISPQDISYLELHGTGTKVGDFQELRAVQSYFGNKPRNKPLFVGSLKSNMGHSELACGLCSLTKVIIAMESGIIPANLYAEPLDMELPGIKEKTVQVVTKNTKYDGGLIGVNSFGMGGTDAHVVLKPNTHKKTYDCNNLKHRLVQISGRTEKAVVDSLSEIQRNENDVEFLALIDEIHKSNVQQHDFRGYIVLGSQPVQEVVRFKGQRPIWFIYSGIGSQWTKMGKDLMNIPVFKNSIEQCVKALEPYNVDLINIITNENYQYTSRVALSCAIIAVEIGLTDVLNSIGIVPDGIVGHSLGEVGAAYADGTMTLEQAILVAYARGFSLDSVNLIPGQMAAVGLSKEQILPMLPEDICVACHNSSTNITISGPKESVKSFVEELTAQNIFAKLVNSLDVPYHSKYIQDSLPVLFDFCKKVLDNPKPRSNKWISSSVGENDKNQEWSQFNCAEYHCNNVRNPVLFDEIFKYIPKNALVVEIAPHGLLQSILKRELDPNVCNVSIANRFSEDNQQFFLSAIGKIYTAGGQPNLRKLYNDVTFPVSCNTKMLSPLVQWDHKLSWFVPLWKLTESFGDVVRINLSDKRYAHYQDQQIDGRHIMPVMGYMEVLWEVFAKLKLQNLEKVPVVIENITFHRVVILSYEEDVVFLVNIMKQSGNFEISESGTLVCSGTIRGPTDMSSEFLLEQSELPDASKNINYTMKREDIYKDLLLRRLEYNTMFKSLLSCNLQGCNGTIEWNGNFCSFLDGMLHVKLIASSRDLLLPTSIKQIIIDPISHMHLAEKNKEMPIMYRPDLNIIKSGQIEIIGVDYIKAYSNQHQQKPNLETYEFVYYDQEENVYSFKDSLQITLEIVLQNNLGLPKKLEICEIKNDSHSERFSDKIKNILDLQPQSDVQYVMEDSEHLQQQYDLLVYSKNKKFDTTKLTENGFILYIGKEHVVQSDCLQIVYRATTTENNIYLLKPKFEIPEKHAVINVSNSNFDWLQNIQKLLLKKDTEVIYLVSNEENSGIVGLINCLLTEPSEIKFRSILTDKKARPFSIRDGLYKQQLEKNLTINVLKNDVWGTFVHLPVQDLQTKEVPNASVTVLKQGDISSLCWIERETPVKRNSDVDNIVNIYYSAVNAEDVLVAKGSPQLEDNENAPTATDVYMGHEYSGITLGGKRVMGLLRNGAMSMQIQTDSIYSWDVPESWSLEDAATVPYTYLMCLHAMIIKGKIQASDSILIFNGRSAVEIAAINIAMSMKCNIFVCAKTNEDKEFIKNKYPGLSGDQIGNIQNSDFASNISKRTNGKGVDLVLNAFNLNVFQSCIRCIAQNGRFLEIGTSHVDISEAAKTKMSLKNNTYHETCLEDIINCPVQLKQEIHSIFFKCLKDKVVKPLPRVLFNKFDLESAFNSLTPEIQTKVIIQLNEETNINSLSLTNKMLALPRIYFHPEKSYILVGGLGGFGLEVTNWMIKKGARKFVLNSRNGIQNGYQAYCLEKWSQFKDVVIKINNDDTSTISGAEKLVKCAQSLGSVGGVFNMAAVLRDAPIFDQVKENFEQVFLPKLVSSQNMDTVTRRLCTGLDHFIMFSSVTSGKGNAGQTNYGMANSALERLCETRRQGKLPGLVIQWGPPAEIGVLVDEENSENVIPNVQHEKLNSCLKTLEYFMLQSYTIGSSLVVDKRDTTSITTATTAVELVARLLDITNLDQVDKSKTLSQFGLDSLLATEIKQTLFRTHKLNFSINEVRDITLYSLEQLEES